MSDALFPSDPETTPVRPEHLNEGMIVHQPFKVGTGQMVWRGPRTVIDTECFYNPYGEAVDDYRVRFTDGTHVWVSANESVEVEC